nr:glycosyltransferase [Arcanobacterium pluranimalium]
MLNAYRSYASFLNVNSIVGSPSMFSRRVFELLACATPVISTPSLGIRATLGDAVVQVESAESAAHWIRAFSYSANLREEYGYYGQMKVLSAHTYSHRVDDILNDLGLTEHTVGMPGVSVLLATNRPHQLRHAFEQCARQRGVETELLVCANGFDVTAEHYALAEKFELSPRWIKPQHEDTLGDYYNLLLRHARFPVVAKIDDDDIYGAYYLLEQVTALRTMNADLVGKKSHIVRFHGGVMNEADEANSLPGVDALPYRDAVAFDGAEHQFVSFVPGPTMVMTASLAQELGFDTRNRGEDTAFIHKAIGAGAKIWSTSRFGFVQNRFVSGHTWQSDPVHILAHSRMIGSEYYVN